MTTDRPAGIPPEAPENRKPEGPENRKAEGENRKSDLPRKTLPAMTGQENRKPEGENRKSDLPRKTLPAMTAHERRKSELPRQTLPAMTQDIQITERPAMVKLISGRSVAVLQTGGEERVEIRSATGEMLLSVRLTDEGPVFSLAGASFEIAAAKSLSLTAETIDVKARKDLSIEAGRTLRAGGRDVDVVAEPGQVAIRANDDVDITGERVRLNSDDPPMPQSMDEHRARRALNYDPFSAPLSPARFAPGHGDTQRDSGHDDDDGNDSF